MFEHCKICGQKKANSKHIETHGLKYIDYLKAYEPKEYNRKQIIKYFNDLYITTRFRFSILQPNGSYYTIYEKNRGYRLSDSDIMDHLKGKKAVAIYFPKNKTKFMTFDIDTKDTSVAQKCADAILDYLPRSCILASFSGNKGYHIDVFFDGFVSKNHVKKFYEMILQKTGYSDKEIECRGHTGQAVKLPLGVNFKNPVAQLKPIEARGLFINFRKVGTVKALKSVKKLNPQSFYDIVNKHSITKSKSYLTNPAAVANNLNSNLSSSILDKAEKLLETGITEKGTRHESIFYLGLYYKEKGYKQDETKKLIEEWLFNKCNTKLYKSSDSESLRDISDTVDCIFKNNYSIGKSKDIILVSKDIKEIFSVKPKSLRNLYWAMYKHCIAHGNDNGEFYMTYDQMRDQGAGKINGTAMNNKLNKLEDLGKIQILKRSIGKKGSKKNKPNTYRIKALAKNNIAHNPQQSYFKVCNKENKCANCFEKACVYLLDRDELKNYYKRNYKNLLKLKGKCKPNNTNLCK